MSIHPLIRKRDDGTAETDGVFVAVRVYPIVHGEPASELQKIKKNFPASKGYRLRDAEKWEREQRAERDRVEMGRRFDTPGPARADRTIEEMAEYYEQHESFLSKEASSRARIHGIIVRFLAWNRMYGRPRVSLWSETVARLRVQHVRDGYHGTDGRRHNAHTGQGLALQLLYAKKLFTLELTRDDTVLKKNPWPTIYTKKSADRDTDPHPFSDRAIDALFEHMTGYEYPLFCALYNTGMRSEELLQLPKAHVEMEGGRPARVLLTKTKNHKRRKVTLTPQGADAVLALLALADDSPLLVRRDFVTTQTGTRIKTPLLDALERIKKRAVKTYPDLEHEFFGRVAEIRDGETKPRLITCVHSFRATFVTNLHAKGVALTTIAQLIGDKVSTLERYIGIRPDVHAEAVLKLRPIGGYGHPDGHSTAVAKMNQREINLSKSNNSHASNATITQSAPV